MSEERATVEGLMELVAEFGNANYKCGQLMSKEDSPEMLRADQAEVVIRDYAQRLSTQAQAPESKLRGVLLRNGFVECDIAACNCGSWHARYGMRERFEEFKDALVEAGHPPCNANGNIALKALQELIAERDSLLAAAPPPETAKPQPSQGEDAPAARGEPVGQEVASFNGRDRTGLCDAVLRRGRYTTLCTRKASSLSGLCAWHASPPAGHGEDA